MSEVERTSGPALGSSEVDRVREPVEHEPVEHERPEDWGWHADFGRLGRIAGWICVLVLLWGISATHYNNSGTGALLITAGLLVMGLLWDARRRRTSWRR